MGTNTSDLKEIKQAIVMEMVKMWSSSTKAITHDWLELTSVELENGHQLLWKCYSREEVKYFRIAGQCK